MGDEIKNPSRTLPRSIYIAAPFVAFLYIAGTASVLWLVPSADVHVVSGFFQAMAAGARDVGGWFWIIPAAATLYVLGNIGGIGAWLTGPARVAFVIGLDRYFPPAFGRVHPRWKTPYVAILTQAVLATVFLMLSVLGRGTTVEKAYLILLDTMLLIYFIPYIYLFLCYLRVRRGDPVAAPAQWRRGKVAAGITGLAGLLLTLGAMIVATIPPTDTADPWLFRLKVIGGAALFVILGGAVYWRGRRTGR
jgi:glutamate:GABA antiporter